MPLSDKTKNRLLSLIAVSRIMRFGVVPGLIGFALIGIGYYLQINPLIIVGVVLAIPVFWAYFVIMVIFPLFVLYENLSKR